MSESNFTLHPDSSRVGVLANCCAFLHKLDAGKAWRVTVKPYRKPRSLTANSYLWSAVYPEIVRALGHTDEDWHEFMCCQYFGTRHVVLCGAQHSRPIRTTTTDQDGKRSVLDSRSFWEFVEFVRDQAAAGGVYVPGPNEAAA